MKKNDPHTKKVLRLFKWFLKCHGVVDEYKRLLKADLSKYGPKNVLRAKRLILEGFVWPDKQKWLDLDDKWEEICDAFNL